MKAKFTSNGLSTLLKGSKSLDYMIAFSEASHDIDANERNNAATILNLYLDEEMRYAISVYSNRPDVQ